MQAYVNAQKALEARFQEQGQQLAIAKAVLTDPTAQAAAYEQRMKCAACTDRLVTHRQAQCSSNTRSSRIGFGCARTQSKTHKTAEHGWLWCSVS